MKRRPEMLTAKRLRLGTDLVDSRVAADIVRVVHARDGLALVDLVPTAALAHVRVQHVLVHGVVDGLDPVRVVIGNVRVRRPLHLAVDAGVDEEEGVQVDDVLLACFGAVPGAV